MNDMSLQFGVNAGFGMHHGPEGFGHDSFQFDGGASMSNHKQAMMDIMEASHTHNPHERKALLQQALNLLQQGNGSNSGGLQPMQTSVPTPEQTSVPAPEQTSTPTPMSTSTPASLSNDPSDPTSDSQGLTVSGNSVNTGEYTITASTNDTGSLTITNNDTGQSTEVWGDPHIKVNGQDTADFQQDDLNIQLQDGTTVHIQPTALSNGVAHIGQVSITKGDQAVTMSGSGSDGFENSVSTSGVMNDAGFQSSLYNTPTATNITLGSDGNLYYDNANGSMGAEITPTNGGETDLDGAGGGLVNGSSNNGSQSTQQLLSQLMSMVGQQQQSFYSMMTMQEQSHMMSQTA